MCANAFTMRSADTCIFRDPYMKKRPKSHSYLLQGTETYREPTRCFTRFLQDNSITYKNFYKIFTR